MREHDVDEEEEITPQLPPAATSRSLPDPNVFDYRMVERGQYGIYDDGVTLPGKEQAPRTGGTLSFIQKWWKVIVGVLLAIIVLTAVAVLLPMYLTSDPINGRGILLALIVYSTTIYFNIYACIHLYIYAL